MFTGQSKTAWIYLLLGVVVLYVTRILGTGQSLSELGKGISDFLSPQIKPSFVPTIGLKLDLPFGWGSSPSSTGYTAPQIQYVASGLGEVQQKPTTQIKMLPSYEVAPGIKQYML